MYQTTSAATATPAPRRDGSIDLLKALSIFGVIVIHTCVAGYSNPIPSFQWTSTVFWGVLTRASVPLFFMCSGVLFLNPEKELSIRRLFTKYISRIVVAMLVWAMAYKLFHGYLGGLLSPANLLQWVKEVLLFKHETHLYYLHIALLFYALVPIVRVFVKNASKAELQYALGLWFLLGIVYPTVKNFWPFTLLAGIPTQYLMNMTYASIGYGLLGHYLSRYKPSFKVSLLCFLAGFAFVFGTTVCLSIRSGTLYQQFLEGMSVGVAVLAVGIWGLCTHASRRVTGRLAAAATYLSKASFCVFLVHLFFLNIFTALGLTVHILPCIISIPLIAACNLALSCGVYFLLSKIPLVNKWLI